MTPLRVLTIAAVAMAVAVALPAPAVVALPAPAVVALPAPAVAASCAENPPPGVAVFTGTVTATDHGGRRATVTTDAGETVTVVGTPDLDASATSVDRIYAVGARYEFHALNAASPFMDNACTNTRQITAAPAATASSSRSEFVVAIGGGAIVLSGLAALLAVLWRRRQAAGGHSAPVVLKVP